MRNMNPGSDARTRLRVVWSRLVESLQRRRLQRELNEEFDFHMAMEVEFHRRNGLSAAEAIRAARLAFGSRPLMQEGTMDSRGFVSIDNAERDLRFAARRLWRARGFAFATILTIALAGGVTAGVGVLVYGVLFRSLPYPYADRLVLIQHDAPGIGVTGAGQSGALDALYRSDSKTLDGTGVVMSTDGVSITDGEQPERVKVALIAPRLLALLGAKATVGRVFSLDDSKERVVLISHALWLRRYGGDSAVLGRRIELNRRASRIVGVLAPSFSFPHPDTQVWYALSPDTVSSPLTATYLTGIGRLREGVTAEQAESELTALTARIPLRFPRVSADEFSKATLRPRVQKLQLALVSDARNELLLLGAGVLFVLLIATANLLNLFLLRAESAQREVAVSRALGATPATVLRRFLSEGLVVGTAGALLALPLAVIGVQRHFGFAVGDIPRLDEVRVTGMLPVIVFALCIGMAALVSVAAWLRSSRAVIGVTAQMSLRTGNGPAWRLVQRSAVIGQVALALTLLVASALTAKSLLRLLAVNPGFDATNTLAFDLPLPFSAYPAYGQSTRFQLAVLDSLRSIPGVSSAEAMSPLPLRSEKGDMSEQVALEGAGTTTGERATSARATIGFVSPGLFSALHIPLESGRAFASGDFREAPPVILSHSLARELAGTGDIVGRYVRLPDAGGKFPAYEVVGVVGDVSGRTIADGPIRTIYFPNVAPTGSADSVRTPYLPRENSSIVVRTSVAPNTVIPAVRRIVAQLDKRLPVARVTTLAEMLSASTSRARLTLLLLGLATIASFVLGIVGLYGVIAYSVAARTREFGIRLAIGAAPAQLMRFVLGEGARVALIGAAVGLLGGACVAQSMRAMLFDTSPWDPMVFVSTALLTLLVALGACFFPARRASRIDPAISLRSDE